MNYNTQLEIYPLYDIMKDEEIVVLAKEGNEKAANYLALKYRNFVRSRTKAYFLIGADSEDVFQEGMIGLLKAIRDYNEDRCSTFKCFAQICITRQIITAVKTATRQKHSPLNSYISLNKPLYGDESERTLFDAIGNMENFLDPEEMVISRESISTMETKLNKVLTKLELKALKLYLEGRTYQEVAAKMNRQVKSIDNALQRVKRKLEKFFDDDDV